MDTGLARALATRGLGGVLFGPLGGLWSHIGTLGTAGALGLRAGSGLATALLLLLAGGSLRGDAVGIDLGGMRAELKAIGVEDLGGLAHEGLDVVEPVHIIDGHKRQRPSLLAGTARAADAVDIVDRVLGNVEVHHVADIGDVDAAGEHVRGDQHVALARAEGLEGTLALGLAAVAVDGGAGDAGAGEAAAAGVGTVLGAAEHDHAVGPLALENIREQRVLGFEGHREHVLLNRVGRGGDGRDLDAGGIGHQVGDGTHGLLIQGRGEQQGLTVVARIAHDAADGGQKAHVEHAVGLVEDEHLHLVERAGALVDEVLQATGGSDEDVAAALEFVALRVVAHAAHHGDARVPGSTGDRSTDLLDLLGELARGRDDEHERALGGNAAASARAGHVRQVVHGGKEEGGRLTRARLSGGENILSVEGMRNRGGLNRSRGGVAHVGDGGENLLGKAEVGERRGRSLGRSRIEFGDVGGSQNGPFPRGKRQQRHPTWVRSPNRPRCGVDMHKWRAGRSARWSVFANGIDANTWSRFHRRQVYGLQMCNLGTGANYTSAQQAYSLH